MAIKTIVISPADFSGSTYQNSLLIGKTPMTQFNIWTLGGSGSLLTYPDGYTFDSVTGTVTMPSQDYLILVNDGAISQSDSYGCESCYVTIFKACTDNATISPALPINSIFYLFVTDKFDNLYIQQVATDGSGAFIIDFSAYPETLFTENSGFFEMTVSESSAFSTNETLTFDGSFYNCIIFSFIKTTMV